MKRICYFQISLLIVAISVSGQVISFLSPPSISHNLLIDSLTKNRIEIMRKIIAFQSISHYEGGACDLDPHIATISASLETLKDNFNGESELIQFISEQYARLNAVVINLQEFIRYVNKQTKQEEVSELFLNECLEELNRCLLTIQEARSLMEDRIPGNNGFLGPLTYMYSNVIKHLRFLEDKIGNRLRFANGTPQVSLHSIADIIAEACGKDMASLYIHPIPRRVNVYADRLSLISAITNVIKNAIHFTANKNVSIGYDLKDNECIIMIVDDGPGIPEELLKIDPSLGVPYIFNLFFTTRKDGTGIGLPETFITIKDMKGSIDVYSLRGIKRTMFALHLPIVVPTTQPHTLEPVLLNSQVAEAM
ncbi:MAG: hypothetical protein GF384_08815 [Elusimicrobia bacterium]|nr:hypothetical protein [Elusimicrobiota bacterium]